MPCRRLRPYLPCRLPRRASRAPSPLPCGLMYSFLSQLTRRHSFVLLTSLFVVQRATTSSVPRRLCRNSQPNAPSMPRSYRGNARGQRIATHYRDVKRTATSLLGQPLALTRHANLRSSFERRPGFYPLRQRFMTFVVRDPLASTRHLIHISAWVSL